MYQSHVYLEVRILASTQRQIFPVQKETISLVEKLCKVLGCVSVNELKVEKLTGILPVPKEYDFHGYSIKIAEKGSFAIQFHNRKKNIVIEEVRLEEDAGRLTHSENNTRMDYTYAGCPSIRIKTSSAFELGEEAEIFLNEIRNLVQYLGFSESLPVESIIRCNAYSALAKYPSIPSYYVKIRNLNSFNFVRKAINAELNRQEEILVSGGIVPSESRLWNERQNITELYKPRNPEALRRYEEVLGVKADTIYPVVIKESYNIDLELPEMRRQRFCKIYGLSRARSEFICDDKDRADFFEQVVKEGADPMDSAHWMSSELIKLLKWNNLSIMNDRLTSSRFATVIKLFHNHEIHSGIAKQLLQSILELNLDPLILIKKNNWKQISQEEILLPIISETIEHYPSEAEKLRNGDMAPLEFLTGLVMKKTNGMAVPQIVKALLKKELQIQIVYVISMGGAICGTRRQDGDVYSNNDEALKKMVLANTDKQKTTRYQFISLMNLLSEEIEPADWAKLIAEISARISAGIATGIVIAHGTDTLVYTASLLFWLFSDSEVPIVITASSQTPDKTDEALENIKLASKIACEKSKGVFVVYGGKVLSPLNLKFNRPDSQGFSNWNLLEPVYSGSGPIALQIATMSDMDSFVMTQLLREAADSMIICKVYPGLNAEHYKSMIDNGVKDFILELYDTGTASMRSCDYSLKPLLIKGRKNGCSFYCTSQQESLTDFSGYTTSRRMWREGAVPMGKLTTESVSSLYFAVSLVADTKEERALLMEQYAQIYSK